MTTLLMSVATSLLLSSVLASLKLIFN